MPAGGPTRWGYQRLGERHATWLTTVAGVRPDDLVIDVGAGVGAITGALVRAEARVIAVELHPRRAQILRDRFAGEPVRVVQVDATDLRLPRRPFRVVANPPFSITTALLRRLLAHRSALRSAHLIVPFHVARRWVGGRAPGARRWEQVFDIDICGSVPGTAFRPAAHTRMAVLVVQRAARHS